MENKALILLLLAGLMTGCATADRIILLPQADGRPSAVVVESKAGVVVLDKPYAVADVSGSSIKSGALTADEVNQKYAVLQKALPPKPVMYVLNFELGSSTKLTAASNAMLDDILDQMRKFPAADAVIVGHADMVGTDAVNDKLSRDRAEWVRKLLNAKGIDIDHLEVVGRGSREPLVPTARGVSEPRNRRVEIRVR